MKFIVDLLKAKKINFWICDVTAREMYLGQTPKYINIAVALTIDEIKDLFPDRIDSINEYNTSVVIRYKDKNYTLWPLKNIKLVKAFREFNYVKRPVDDTGPDFTIDGLYYDTETKQVLDYHGCESDIDNKIIRFIGEAEYRISISRVSLLRAVILPAILGDGWSLDHIFTAPAITRHRLKLMALSPEQIYPEIRDLLKYAKKPSEAFKLMRRLGVLEIFFPELYYCTHVPQDTKGKDVDLFMHIMYALDSVPINKANTFRLRLAVLLHDLGKVQSNGIYPDKGMHFYGHEYMGATLAHNIMKRWGIATNVITSITTLIKNHSFGLTKTSSLNSIRKLITKVGSHNIHDLLDLRTADCFGTTYSNIDLSMIESWRDKVNIILPDEFKLAISEDSIERRMMKYTEFPDETYGPVISYLKTLIINNKLKNNVNALEKKIEELMQIECPLDKGHLFKTWNAIESDSIDTFADGKLTCGIYCNFKCNDILNKEKEKKEK